ncbi:General secretion pathway protein GspN [Burkholderiales bacterium 8X]|nr:General secretion pathway protein GspN [Burkholderiales bacterium 8X]
MQADPLLTTSRTGWRWAVLGGLLGALIALAIFAPARWLASALDSATEGRLRLVNPRGTVWNGSSSVIFASGATGNTSIALPGNLQWELRPRWGGAVAILHLPCCAQQPLRVDMRRAAGGTELWWQDGRSRWPAAMLTGFGAPWNTLKPEGSLDIATQGFAMRFEGPMLRFAGRAALEATDISSSLSTLRPMGSYRLTLDGGANSSFLLTTREGSLQLSGSGRWDGTALRFNGEASAAPGREDALSNLLNIIGRRDGARSLITLG